MDKLLRIFTLLAKSCQDHTQRRHYMLTAHLYAMRLLTTVLKSATERKRGMRMPRELPFTMPPNLWDWATGFKEEPALSERLEKDNTLTGLTARSLPTPNWTVAYLDELIGLLEQDGAWIRFWFLSLALKY